jgi:hypothetical protein
VPSPRDRRPWPGMGCDGKQEKNFIAYWETGGVPTVEQAESASHQYFCEGAARVQAAM